MTSSAINNTPYREQISRARGQKSSTGTSAPLGSSDHRFADEGGDRLGVSAR
jgi:hypothetical protein